MTASDFLLYGSYGYTGELIAELAAKEGLRPLLAGRDEARLKAQAQKYNLEYRVFTLDNKTALDSALLETRAVLHCAGPFVHTFRQMAEACIRTKKHYTDISGEIEGFEALAAMDDEAKRAGVMLMPGVGFDVVPTDCLNLYLKERLPSATHLRLYIRGVGAGFSRGTAKSAIENMHRQGRVRRNGKIVQVPPAWKIRDMDFGRGPVHTVTIGWGDVSVAYHTTGIPNVETYMTFPRRMIDFLRATRVIGPLLYARPMRRFLQAMIDLMLPPGPPRERREKGLAIMIGEVHDDQGNRASAKLTTPEGYTLTALTSIEIIKRILADPQPGFQTPGRVYGKDFILAFPRVLREDLE